ncbi:MAG: 1-(5-phosphoribosyl)-5-[(5-phosphoribosylamino)methylideneamino]imidazole-4-carboxamide isomerase [Candidatus Odinarchaeia archaeon]
MIILLLIPAVDLKNGMTVRLYQGKPETAKVYYQNPLEAAKNFENEGAEIIHVVDLDAAIGLGSNIDTILKIVRNVSCKIEVGGGIRDFETASKYLNNGVERVVIGTATYKNPKLVRRLVKEYGSNRIMAAVDHYGQEVKIKGWTEGTGVKLYEYLKLVEELDVGFILLSSIKEDGALTGPDVKTLSDVAATINTPIIAAGGISSIKDIIKLKNINLYGVIIGRALYENIFTFKDALKALEG